MRCIFAKSLQDGKLLKMGSDTDPVCEIMDIGKYTGTLQYEVEMTGEQLAEFVKKYKYQIDQSVVEQIELQHNYIVVAMDW